MHEVVDGDDADDGTDLEADSGLQRGRDEIENGGRKQDSEI